MIQFPVLPIAYSIGSVWILIESRNNGRIYGFENILSIPALVSVPMSYAYSAYFGPPFGFLDIIGFMTMNLSFSLISWRIFGSIFGKNAEMLQEFAEAQIKTEKTSKAILLFIAIVVLFFFALQTVSDPCKDMRCFALTFVLGPKENSFSVFWIFGFFGGAVGLYALGAILGKLKRR